MLKQFKAIFHDCKGRLCLFGTQLAVVLLVAPRDGNSTYRVTPTTDTQIVKWRDEGMLVLSRKNGERIHIGEDIFVEVRRIAGNRVTLAISAPRSVRVLRGELLEAAKSFQQPTTNVHHETAAQPEQTTQSEPTKSETYIITHEHVASNEHYPGSHVI